MSMATLQIEIPHEEMEAYAQILKRTGYSDYEEKATSQTEAVNAHCASLRIRDALVKAGYAPR